MVNLKLTRPLIVVDIETTGLNVYNDRIVDICMIKLFPDGTEKVLNSLVDPCMPIPPEAATVHGIKDGDVKGKPDFKALSGKIADFMAGSDFCGFNIERFDLPFIVSELARSGIAWSMRDVHIVDVQKIFHKLEPRNLGAAYKKYCGKEMDGLHRAENDARATIDVLHAQLDQHDELPGDVQSLNEFVSPKDPSWIDRYGKFAWRDGDAVISFGRHKGRTLKDLAANEQDYLRWILAKDFSLEVKSIAAKALEGTFPKS